LDVAAQIFRNLSGVPLTIKKHRSERWFERIDCQVVRGKMQETPNFTQTFKQLATLLETAFLNK
jgi:hypothetical protein